MCARSLDLGANCRRFPQILRLKHELKTALETQALQAPSGTGLPLERHCAIAPEADAMRWGKWEIGGFLGHGTASGSGVRTRPLRTPLFPDPVGVKPAARQTAAKHASIRWLSGILRGFSAHRRHSSLLVLLRFAIKSPLRLDTSVEPSCYLATGSLLLRTRLRCKPGSRCSASILMRCRVVSSASICMPPPSRLFPSFDHSKPQVSRQRDPIRSSSSYLPPSASAAPAPI